MLVQENELHLVTRLGDLEKGVKHLDDRISNLDEKVMHVMQQNSEMLIRQGEEFRGLRDAMEDHRSQLDRSIRTIKGQYSSRCQLIGFGAALTSWTIFMAWVMWA